MERLLPIRFRRFLSLSAGMASPSRQRCVIGWPQAGVRLMRRAALQLAFQAARRRAVVLLLTRLGCTCRRMSHWCPFPSLVSSALPLWLHRLHQQKRDWALARLQARNGGFASETSSCTKAPKKLPQQQRHRLRNQPRRARCSSRRRSQRLLRQALLPLPMPEGQRRSGATAARCGLLRNMRQGGLLQRARSCWQQCLLSARRSCCTPPARLRLPPLLVAQALQTRSLPQVLTLLLRQRMLPLS